MKAHATAFVQIHHSSKLYVLKDSIVHRSGGLVFCVYLCPVSGKET